MLPESWTRHLFAIVLALIAACSGQIGEPGSPHVGAVPVDGEGSPRATLEGRQMMRLTTEQVLNSLEDIFAVEVLPTATSLPADRDGDHFASMGAAHVATSERGVELYQAVALEVATKIWEHRAKLEHLAGCEATEPNDPCIAEALRAYGGRLWRRPLTDAEVAQRVAFARQAVAVAAELDDAPAEPLTLGVRYALASLLASPNFLYVAEGGEVDPDLGAQRYTSQEMASRLAFFIWNSTPDVELLAAAEAGQLTDPAGIETQVRRMLHTGRGPEHVVRFFAENWRVKGLAELSKDSADFPEWTPSLAAAAREEFRRVLLDITSGPDGRLLDVFDGRATYVNVELASLYELDAPTGSSESDFVPVELGAHRHGLLTSAAVLASTAKPNRTSPTLRGVFLRWHALCLPVPPPTDGVMVELASDMGGEQGLTVREELEQHRSIPECAGCHTLFDPMGMTLENFDAIGRYRTTDRGQPIDPSGEFEGQQFDDVDDLAAFLGADARAAACLGQHLYSRATGRVPAAGERPVLDKVAADFERAGHRFEDLVVSIATSVGFRYFAEREGSQ